METQEKPRAASKKARDAQRKYKWLPKSAPKSIQKPPKRNQEPPKHVLRDTQMRPKSFRESKEQI